MSVMELTPGAVTLADLATVLREERAVTLDPACKPAVEAAAARIAQAAAGDAAVYGVNTGFGKLASLKIAPEDTATLQRNLILSHCCGVGEPISRAHARLIMVFETAGAWAWCIWRAVGVDCPFARHAGTWRDTCDPIARFGRRFG